MLPILQQADFVMPHYEGFSPQLLKPRQLPQAGFKACDYVLLILLIPATTEGHMEAPYWMRGFPACTVQSSHPLAVILTTSLLQ